MYSTVFVIFTIVRFKYYSKICVLKYTTVFYSTQACLLYDILHVLFAINKYCNSCFLLQKLLFCVTFCSNCQSLYLSQWRVNLTSMLKHKFHLSKHICTCAHVLINSILQETEASRHVERGTVCCDRTFSQFVLLFSSTRWTVTHKTVRKSILESQQCWPATQKTAENHREPDRLWRISPALVTFWHTRTHISIISHTDTHSCRNSQLKK